MIKIRKKGISKRSKGEKYSVAKTTFVTVHPSSLLRAPDEAARAEAYALFLRDLRKVAKLL